MNALFFNRNPDIVARELLGKILIREINGKKLRARIVETEAYFDENDPSSRARSNGDIRETMMMDPGTILVYGVHNNWLVNFVTDKKGIPSAVLIRAVEPLNFNENCRGPGLLTKAMKINKNMHKSKIGNNMNVEDDEIRINEDEIASSNRIGVTSDLDKPMRFFVKDNKWVSRR